ncbi:MAG: hypothetical protein NUV91_01780 [Candidatus Omnitrophica bacterium]|nr:hypothetical protein [Candidatus Omnitrophota bacterium]
MEILIILLQLLTVVVVILFRNYLKKKGENLATKEDVEEITEKVESLKAAIGSQQFIHQTRYQNEFEILKELSEKIIELSDAARSLRPVIDSFDNNESDEERKKRRLSEYRKAASDFYDLFQVRQAFYPEDIYKALQKLDHLAYKEAVEYAHFRKTDGHDPKYWENSKKNSDEIYNLANEIMRLIRDRVKCWEDFEFKK